jgi:hypothetical protein
MTTTSVPATTSTAGPADTGTDPGTDSAAQATMISERSDLPRHDLPVLEVFRGLAAVMVVFTHVGFIAGPGVVGPWAGWLSRLDFGVTLFFLLSGFLLFRPFVQAAYGRRAPVKVGSYLRRRYVRIYPAFLVVLFFDYLITPGARQASGSLWLQTALMVQNYTVNFVHQLPGRWWPRRRPAGGCGSPPPGRLSPSGRWSRWPWPGGSTTRSTTAAWAVRCSGYRPSSTGSAPGWRWPGCVSATPPCH